MLTESSWKEFFDSGLLWWINRSLHLFGWAIVLEFEGAEILRAYPAKTAFRGFSGDLETEGFIKLTNHMAENMPRLLEDAKS